MSEMISTDRPLSEGQQVLLTALLDTLLPASADGRMPSAADVGAPFPQGNEITPGDLSLLDPVIESSARHRYRQP
ncbi:MAG: hypothetical protein P8Y69_12980 [Gammaproteobacteria bacterium]